MLFFSARYTLNGRQIFAVCFILKRNKDMQPTGKTIWFPAKKYGWGWGLPNCWQGWLVVAAYLALLCAGAILISKQIEIFLAYTTVLSIILMVICYLKGEKPRWRWGKE